MLPIPELNEERRTQLTKVAGQYAESARVSIRNVRRDGMDQIKKAKADGMSEDDQKVWEGEVQDMTNKFIGVLRGVFVIDSIDLSAFKDRFAGHFIGA